MIRCDAEALHAAADAMQDGAPFRRAAVADLIHAIADRWEITPSGVLLAATVAAKTVRKEP